jgi:hypothetical protein
MNVQQQRKLEKQAQTDIDENDAMDEDEAEGGENAEEFLPAQR